MASWSALLRLTNSLWTDPQAELGLLKSSAGQAWHAEYNLRI